MKFGQKRRNISIAGKVLILFVFFFLWKKAKKCTRNMVDEWITNKIVHLIAVQMIQNLIEWPIRFSQQLYYRNRFTLTIANRVKKHIYFFLWNQLTRGQNKIFKSVAMVCESAPVVVIYSFEYLFIVCFAFKKIHTF